MSAGTPIPRPTPKPMLWSFVSPSDDGSGEESVVVGVDEVVDEVDDAIADMAGSCIDVSTIVHGS